MHGWTKKLLPLAAAAMMVSALTAAPAQTASTTPVDPAQPSVQAPPGTFKRAIPVDYMNRYEVFGGISMLSYQAGQNLPQLMTMGGAEVQGTMWLNDRWGVMASGRAGAGTTPVLSHFYNRVVAYQETGLAGVNMRWLKNQYAAMGVHAMAGASHGVFDYAVQHYPGGSPVGACTGPQNLGLFCNATKFQGVAGLTVDFNRGQRWAIRLQPEAVLDHRSTELRSFFYLGGGVVYRFGHR